MAADDLLKDFTPLALLEWRVTILEHKADTASRLLWATLIATLATSFAACGVLIMFILGHVRFGP